MCQYCSTVTVCDSNPHCHYISAHCYQCVRLPQLFSHVPVLQYSYCMGFESSLSLYQCTLLPISTVATAVQPCASTAVQLLYGIRILTVTISVHTVTNMYGSHSCSAMCQYCSTVTVCNSNPHIQYSLFFCTDHFKFYKLNYIHSLQLALLLFCHFVSHSVPYLTQPYKPLNPLNQYALKPLIPKATHP